MHDDDLRNFFNEDAYKELMQEYAEEDERKKLRAEQDAMKKKVSSDTRRIPQPKGSMRDSAKSRNAASQASAAHPKTASQTNTRPQRSAPAKGAKEPPQAQIDDTPIMPMSPAEPVYKADAFKLEIKGLDEEFNTAPKVPDANSAARRARTAEQNRAARNGANAHSKARAFGIFAESGQKSRSMPDAAEGDPMVTQAFDEAQTAEKRLPLRQRLNRETVKAFFIQNKATWIVVAICVVCSIFISTYTISCLNDVFAVHRDSETVVTVNIPTNANTRSVLKILQEQDLIEHRHFCYLIAKLVKFKDDNYLTGVYYVTASMGMEKMLTTFKEPTVTGETVTLTFPEGFTVDQILKRLEEAGVCTAALLNQTMREVDFSSEFSFIREEDNKEARYQMLEGYLYPDTYEFYLNESPSSVLRKFLNNFKTKWTEEYDAQAKKLNMSVDDIITLASIVQKEAYGADQSPLVSSVLHNRLKNTGLYPSLQCDSTTEYVNDYIQPNVKDAAALSGFTALYSTYRCEGLPVGAICNPGDEAIKAALFPEKTNYYFFAHDVNKKLYLARNDSERRSNNIAILNANSEAQKKKNQ